MYHSREVLNSKSDHQGHWYSLHSLGHVISHFRDMISYFQKFKDVM